MREIGILDRRIAQTRFHIEQAWREYHHLFLSRGAKVKGKVNNIQGLRAFAAIAVAGFHTRFRFPHMRLFGSFGVEVFFVISGYIMASICVSNSEFFFRRRLLRIVPPYWTATVVMFLAALWFPNLMWTTRPDVGELIKSLLFIPFSRSDGSIEPILSIGWTLNCEMYFYAVLAVSLLIFRRRALWLAAGIILAVTETCMRFGGQSAIGRFYGWNVILDFLLGIVAFFVCRTIPEKMSQRLRLPMLFLLAVSILMLILIQGAFPPLTITRVLTPGILSFLMVGSAALLAQAGWDTNVKWLVLIGDASYVLYLVHPFCEDIIDRVFSHYIGWLRIDAFPGYLISMTSVVLLAVLIHIKVERPMVAYLNRNWGGMRKSVEFSPKHAA